MATLSEPRMQGLRRPGASLKGLPTRPDEAVLSRKPVNTANTGSAAPLSASPTSNGYRSPGVDEKSLPAKPLPPPPQSNTVSHPVRVSSLSPRDEEGRQQNPASRPRSLQPLDQSRPVSEIPLEDFIPEPAPEPEEQQPLQEPSKLPDGIQEGGESDGISDANAPYVPPLPEPQIVPPLTKVHFSCYQSHRSMPVSNNVWYPVACMTCHKLDQEVRYRCTFCCLRICTSCFQALQKCKDRSLAELMSTIKT
ncbi:hypothetical protein VTN77DRAFT_4909 [Rasamsonia byssochlamydoides]|uniref:uncharacterized protein n=1 Tax=Rasamsonia byssochlamydoides TaxID=89139 RepID=UPI003742F81E